MVVRQLMSIAAIAVSLVSFSPSAFAQTQLRMTWYSDGNEGEVVTDLLKRFEAKNPDIKVTIDQVPYKAINETLPVQLAAGEGPDMARIVDLGGQSRYLLDLKPYLKDPSYWEKNFGPFLSWMRALDDHPVPGRVDLYYAFSGGPAPFADELVAIADGRDGVRTHLVDSRADGRLTADRIVADTGVPGSRLSVFLCGPEPMLRDLQRQLRAAGVRWHRIHREYFDWR